jgi:hypothetical protein
MDKIYFHFANELERQQGFVWKIHQKSGCKAVKDFFHTKLTVVGINNLNKIHKCPYCNVELPQGYLLIQKMP